MMNNLGVDLDPNIWSEIQRQFEKIKQESGVEPDEQSQDEIENLLGFSFGDMEKEMELSMKTKTINVEKIHDDAILPSYAYPSDSGFDLYSTVEFQLAPFERALVPTGIKLGFSEGYEIQIRPKSGLALKMGLTVLNTPGTVDSGYNGEIMVIVANLSNSWVTIEKGMKVGQAVLCPVVNGKYVRFEQVDSIEDKDRGSNGFGSTGI